MNADLASYVRRIVDQAPPLNSGQRDRLGTILRAAGTSCGDLTAPNGLGGQGPKGTGERATCANVDGLAS